MKKLSVTAIVLWSILLLCTMLYGINYNGVIFFSLSNVLRRINLLPFDFILTMISRINYGSADIFIEIWYSINNFIFNGCLFLLLGIIIKVHKPEISFYKAMAVVFVIALGKELAELILTAFNIAGKVFDINDIIAALIGGGIGYIMKEKKKCKSLQKRDVL